MGNNDQPVQPQVPQGVAVSPVTPAPGAPQTPAATDLSKFSFNPETNTIHAPTGEVYSTGAPIDIAKSKPQTGPGWDSPGPAGSASAAVATDSGITDTLKAYWHRMGDVMNGSALDPVDGWMTKANDAGKAIVDKEINSNHPYVAAMAKTYFDIQNGVYSILHGALTPANAVFMSMGGPESGQAMKLAVTGANLYFAGRGAKQLLDGRLQNETELDYIARQTPAALQVVLGGAGAKETGAEFLHDAIQKNLGLSGDLAAKVQAKVDAANQIQAVAKGQTESTSQIAQGIAENIQETQIPQRMGSIMGDAAQVIHSEKARVEGLFSDLADKATTPITTSADMRTEIMNTLTAHGVQSDEVPERIFNALPAEPVQSNVRALTASELKAATAMAQQLSHGLEPSEVRSGLINLGYAPKQVDAIMTVVSPRAQAVANDISFSDATRVREDLYSAAQAATDSTIKRALFEAHDNITGMQERYANDNGFGPQYQTAKQEYLNFKRGLGDGKMNDYMNAYDIHDQAMLGHVTKLMSPEAGEAFRRLFRSAGVDISPLEEIIQDRANTSQAAADRVKEIADEAQQAVTKLGLDQSIVHGQSDLQFAGKNNLQIRQEAMQKMVNNARSAGIINPYAYIQTVMGVARASMGSAFGAMQAVTGGSRIGLERLLKNKGFQDWMLQESGATGPNLERIRSSISGGASPIAKLADSFDVPSVKGRAPSTPPPANTGQGSGSKPIGIAP